LLASKPPQPDLLERVPCLLGMMKRTLGVSRLLTLPEGQGPLSQRSGGGELEIREIPWTIHPDSLELFPEVSDIVC